MHYFVIFIFASYKKKYKKRKLYVTRKNTNYL